MKGLSKESASWHEVGEEAEGQRIDNYLTRLLKGVPKSHIYRILRNGEVRVNSGRISADHRLKAGDRIRVPPVRVAARQTVKRPAHSKLGKLVLYEDGALLVIDKPAGMAVHGGSGISLGVIEQLRFERPSARFLELAHRLDRDTSGVLMLAKRRAALVNLHEQLRSGRVRKLYFALVHGIWRNARHEVKLPLHKFSLSTGERRVSVSEDGLAAHTIFRRRWAKNGYSLLEAELKTGRTHQIRVHLAHLGFPIAGDDKYGDFCLNKELAKHGLKRMFLHAWRTVIRHPTTGEEITFEAPLPEDLAHFAGRLETKDAETV
jgi:23S rRNA pseudouridine955/2504/2580 synthase